MVPFFLRNSQQKFYLKNGSFCFFFQLIKNYAETTLLIDKIIISQETSYAAQQNLTGLNLQKPVKEKKFSLDSQ